MPADAANTPYTPAFFADQSDRSLASARAVLPILFASFRPASVVDIGCGVGPWLRAAQDLGVEDILGVDGDYVDRNALLIEPTKFLPVDVERQRLCDIAPLAERRRFDLVISVEVAEHLTYARAESFVNDLTWLGDVILFSAAVPFQGGEHHLNEQWPEFWALLFRARGFDCLDLLRSGVWSHPGVDWWYAQNLLVFVRRGSDAAAHFPQLSLPAPPTLSLVHPANYLAQILKWFHTYRLAAAEEEEADLAALISAYQTGAARLPRLRAIARAESAPDRPDVFPNTRIERSWPETLLREQSERLAVAAVTETALADLRGAHTALITQNTELLTLQGRLWDTFGSLQTRYADLQVEHEILEAAHQRLREAYQADRAAAPDSLGEGHRSRATTQLETVLRRELEDCLLEAREAVAKTASEFDERLQSARQVEERLSELQQDTERRLSELQQHTGQVEERLSELQRSRVVRLAQAYYACYSRPVVGALLRSSRRAAGYFRRLLRS
jgi:SAM-dependent methyltransferase